MFQSQSCKTGSLRRRKPHNFSIICKVFLSKPYKFSIIYRVFYQNQKAACVATLFKTIQIVHKTFKMLLLLLIIFIKVHQLFAITRPAPSVSEVVLFLYYVLWYSNDDQLYKIPKSYKSMLSRLCLMQFQFFSKFTINSRLF